MFTQRNKIQSIGFSTSAAGRHVTLPIIILNTQGFPVSGCHILSISNMTHCPERMLHNWHGGRWEMSWNNLIRLPINTHVVQVHYSLFRETGHAWSKVCCGPYRVARLPRQQSHRILAIDTQSFVWSFFLSLWSVVRASIWTSAKWCSSTRWYQASIDV